MSPAPSLPTDLHYPDGEQVHLDVLAIIARGNRLRRRRLFAKVITVVAIFVLTPAAIVMDMARPTPVQHLGMQHQRGQTGGASIPAGLPVYGMNAGLMNGLATVASPANYRGNIDVAAAVTRHTATIPARYGPVLAIAGASSGSGVWFAAASSRLTLFHLGDGGRVSSWPVLAVPKQSRTTPWVGLAVTATGVAWLAVESNVIRVDTKAATVHSWTIPVPRKNPLARHASDSVGPLPTVVSSLAVSPDGDVAVALSRSSSVQVLDPRTGTFRQVPMPAVTDQPLAVGYALDGTLGVGFRRLDRPHTSAILVVKGAGARLTATVAQATSVTSYGRAGLLVGVSQPEVVSAAGTVRPLALPADSQNFADNVTPPVPLPGNRLGLVLGAAIVTFPAAAASVANATSESELWLATSNGCPPLRSCPSGYRLLATDAVGNAWAVPKADQRTVEQLSLR